MATEKRLDLIDRKKLLDELGYEPAKRDWCTPKSTFGIVLNAPTVDAVEVVRCKDCKHSTLPAVLTQKYGEPGTLTCHNWHSPCNKRNVKWDDFCSYGERKDNGKTD